MAVGGSIIQISLDSRGFSVAADNDATVMYGGLSNETQINGDGTPRDIKTRVAWKVTGLELAIDHLKGDQAALQALANGPSFPIVITLADESVLNMVGNLQGDLGSSTQKTTISVDLSGGGSITQ